jgi:signal transduction histidine kinase
MKNMLQPVLAGMELLKEEVDSLFKDMTATELNRKKESQNLCDEATGMVQRGINRLHERVRELADCIKGLSSPPAFAPCDLAAVIHEVFGTLKVLATEKELSLLTEGLSSLPKLIADEKRLYNAFYNLINNAIPETPPGGSITVGGRLDTELGGIAVWVKDTGRGITKEVLKNLFSARAVSTKRGGTGLGTKIIKDVVDAHHGNICVESTVGVGSTFYIRLPIDPTQVDFRSQTRLP